MAEESIERRLVGGKWSTVARDEGDAPDTWQKAAVHVTAEEIIAIADGTPKVLVAAPDADTVLLWQTIVLTYRAGAVAYDWDPGLHVTWSGFQGITSESTVDVLNSLTSQTLIFRPGNFGFFTDDADPTFSPQGQALVLTSPGPFSPPLGDGTLDVTVYYLAPSLLPV